MTAPAKGKTSPLFVFEGRLVDCDSFMRSIFVGDGRVVWARADSPTVRGS